MRRAFPGFALFLAVAAEVGMDAARLNDAVEFMKSHEATCVVTAVTS